MRHYRLSDPFFDRFYARMPRDVAGTFTQEQLDAIKRVFGARTWGSHAIDIRMSMPILWRRWYVVLLMGPERRPRGRRHIESRRHPVGKLANALAMTLFGVICLGPTLGVIYAVKSRLGVDIFPSDGIHAILHNLTSQVGQLFM